jgi:superfamily I DNA and RNA helicase
MKMKLKGLHFADVSEIQETITDEVKKVQKEEFSVAFQKLYDRAKACMAVEVILNKKKDMSSIFKKSVLKFLDRTVYDCVPIKENQEFWQNFTAFCFCSSSVQNCVSFYSELPT